MRIDSKDVLFEQPVLRIRAVIRDAMMERLISSEKDYIEERVSILLKQSEPVARKVIKQLVKEGYLDFKKVKYINEFQYELKETEKGRRFGIATANAAITREKADMLLNELIERAKQINATDNLVYFVKRIKVFGSYLSDKKLLGDLDVAVKLIRKYEGDNFMKENQKRIDLAFKNGRSFPHLTAEICWPYQEIMLLLKTKKKGLSLHDEDADPVITKTITKIVYEFMP